jgi:hypothetical protein
MILGAIVFSLYPLAPPRFMPGLGMTDTVSLLGLDPSSNSDSTMSYNRFAAMPSLHYTWALFVMTGMFRLGGFWFKAAGITYQALMFVAIIATANHYVLDAVAGAILLMVSMYVLRWWNHYEPLLSRWKQLRTAQLTKLNLQWRTQLGQIVVPNLRELLLSGFAIRGGHAVQPDGSKVVSTLPLRPRLSSSFHPELDDLILVLR